MTVQAEDRRSPSGATTGPQPKGEPTELPAPGPLPSLTSWEVERITRATRRRPLVLLAANDKGGTGKTLLALNLAAVLANRGGGALRVLLLDQNSYNPDLLDLLDVPGEVGGVLDLPLPGGRLTERAYPVPGIPGLDAASFMGGRFRWSDPPPLYPFPSPRSLLDAAAGYDAIVVDTEKASPKDRDTPVGQQLGLWLQEADVCYVVCAIPPACGYRGSSTSRTTPAGAGETERAGSGALGSCAS